MSYLRLADYTAPLPTNPYKRGISLLFIYSGDVPELDDRLTEILGENGLITVIPTSPAEHSTAKVIAEYFEAIEIKAQTPTKRAYLNKNALKNQILSGSAVYLCGGNTYEFLNYAKKMDLFAILEELEANGGIIAAESAGSIILSNNISTAAIPTSCPDENLINLAHIDAMGRIPFHISPHFDPTDDCSKADIVELQVLADESARQVLLLEDGEGFIMQDNKITFFQGQEKLLTPTAQPLEDKTPIL